MRSVELKHNLQKGDFHLRVDTTIPARGVTGVFGQSGAGKTTLLRCIAGLEPSGVGTGIPVHQRKIGYVFQEPQLFSHLTVRKNIEYGLRRNSDSAVSVRDASELLDLDALLERAPASLSGGEAQRVAIARVLCQAPRLILMDEPLSALDERRKDEVLPYLDRLHAEAALPILYVSHNIDEICRLSDHLLVLDSGQVVAEGGLQEILGRIDIPQLGGSAAGTIIATSGCRYDDHYDLTAFRFSGGELWVPGHHDASTARLRIQASDVSVSREHALSSSILNILPARIDSFAADTESTMLLRLHVGSDFLVARITRRSLQELHLTVGEEVYVQIKSVTVRR